MTSPVPHIPAHAPGKRIGDITLSRNREGEKERHAFFDRLLCPPQFFASLANCIAPPQSPRLG
jgi:hypothetical protein